MKRFAFLLFSLTLAVTSTAAMAQSVPSPAPSAAAGASAIVVPGGTSVSVSFLEPVSSDSATEGSKVAVQVTKEVDINGMAVIAKGAQGEATLTKVLHSGGNGSGGKIEFSVDWVTSVDGGKIALSQVNNTTPNADRKGAASTLAIAGWATFGLLGLFTHNLAHGNAAVIKPDKVFSVFVDHTVHVTSTQAASPAAGYDN